MRQIVVIFFVLLLIIIGLEVNSIVPSTILPSLIAIHDAIKANPYILITITNIKTFIANLEIKPFLDAFDESLLSIYAYITSLPWEKINIWYVLGIIFIIGVISEKFRTLSNEIKFINQKLAKIKREVISEDNDSNDNHITSNIMGLREEASNIIHLLTSIKKTTESLRSTELRSKKLRREVMQADSFNNDETPSIEMSSEPERQTSKHKQNSLEQSISASREGHPDNHEEDELDISSDDISPLDLARTYVEAKEFKNAESIIKKIIETGTEHEKHEAKLLFMQLRK